MELGIFVLTTIRRNDIRVDPRTLLVPLSLRFESCYVQCLSCFQLRYVQQVATCKAQHSIKSLGLMQYFLLFLLL